MEAGAEAGRARLGRSDVRTNTAGVRPGGRVDAVRVDDWGRMVDIEGRGVLGGMAADTIETGAGRDIVLGDSGRVRYDAAGLAEATSTDAALGGDDTLTAGAGADLVIGGVGAASLTVANGAHLPFGDDGAVTRTVAASMASTLT